MKSKDKIEVVLKPFDQYGGKYWVKVRFKDGGEWVPAFEDLYRIIRALCYCEDLKYPNGRGRFYVRDFLQDCCKALPPSENASNGIEDIEPYWQELKEKYNFIDR